MHTPSVPSNLPTHSTFPPAPDPSSHHMHLQSTFASDYASEAPHHGHSTYLRESLEKDLHAIHHHVPRNAASKSNTSIYYDGVTKEHSLTIQLQREKRRGDDLADEVINLKARIRENRDERHDAKHRLTRGIHHQQAEIASLSAKVKELEVNLHKSHKEKQEMQAEFADYKRAFEKQLKQHQRTTISTINKAEDSLQLYNDEWSKRLESERSSYLDKIRVKEQMSEQNLMNLQNQFNEAHEFYTEHIQKLRKAVLKEEGECQRVAKRDEP